MTVTVPTAPPSTDTYPTGSPSPVDRHYLILDIDRVRFQRKLPTQPAPDFIRLVADYLVADAANFLGRHRTETAIATCNAHWKVTTR